MDNIIVLNFYNYCNYINYTNLLLTCKYYYYDKNIINNDNIYKYYLIKKFSINFANISRSFIISYYDCFLRIVNFEKIINNLGYETWEEDIYYLFWKQQKLI